MTIKVARDDVDAVKVQGNPRARTPGYGLAEAGAISSSYGLRERGEFMRRVQADPEYRDQLQRMWRKFNKIWFATCALLLATGAFGVLAHPAPLGQQLGSWRTITVDLFYLAFVSAGVWAVVTNCQIRHWISVRARLRWEAERRRAAAEHPWPAPSGRIEY